jgi:hypothetical protein
MAVPGPVTGLDSSKDIDQARLNLRWTNPTGSLTAVKIEGFRPSTGEWETHYAGAVLTSRTVYPTPCQSWHWRVSASTSDGYGATDVVPNITLGLLSGMWAVCLTSVTDPTLYVPLGVTDNDDNGINWIATRDEKLYLPMGQADYDFLYSTQESYIADQMDWLLAPYTLIDGTRVKPAVLYQRLLRMWREKHLLLYRDFDDQMYYCRISQPRPRPYQNVLRRCSFMLTSVAAPAQLLTTAS